tara:strand:+ start:989 stop:1783 length:795 start_codon:yes stop_codon:yes gene_type:complete
MVEPKLYGKKSREYKTQAGTYFLDPIGSHPELGDMMHMIFSKYPEIKEEMINLLKNEGPQAVGEEANKGVGLISTLIGKYLFDDPRTDKEFNELANASIEGLKHLEYVTGIPTLSSKGLIAGEHLFAQTPNTDDESSNPFTPPWSRGANKNYNIRNFEDIPDTVMYESPSILDFSRYNPDTDKREREQLSVDTNESLKTLIHESLLHGMDTWHSSSPMLSSSSSKNYINATEKIFELLSDEHKELLIDFMYPDNRRTPQRYVYP